MRTPSRWGALPLGEPLPAGDGWKAMGPEQPRTCSGCGERVTLKSEPLWFETHEPRETWHWRCRPRKAKR
jgi:hypothetical protein